MNSQSSAKSLALKVDALTLHYQSNTPVLESIALSLEQGQIACLLGESGCGKTSLLRSIAGFEKATSGSISIHGQIVFDDSQNLAVEKRGIGMIFQDYALFPHLSISENISFGLQQSNISRSEHKQAVENILELLELANHKDKYPHQLSGGQQQRVAIGRAIVCKPRLLLLDEPFSNLDVNLREKLAHKLRLLLKQQGITALMVTHDQQEAFAFADKIAVMHKGKIEQWGSADEIYHQPNSAYVADFVGNGVVLSAEQAKLISSTINDHKDFYLFRPEDFLIDAEGEVMARLLHQQNLGHSKLLHCEKNNIQFYAYADAKASFSEGENIRFKLKV